MDAQQFLAQFHHIASALGGVRRVRELVLQLAVSGRLVQRSSGEGTAAGALVEAERLGMDYARALELRHKRPYPALRNSEYPYLIPDHWRWERLEQIACYIQRGKGPSYADTGSTFVVSQKCIRWRGFDLSSARYINEASLTNYGQERFLHPGDLLWNSTGTGTVGRVAIFNEKEDVRAVADSHVTVIRLSNFEPRFVWSVIASPWVQARIAPEHERAIVSGTTKQVELASSSVRALAIPCPPLEEQKRIVGKVDELMALCDKLEAQELDRETLRQFSRRAVLRELANSPTPAGLLRAWTRLQAWIHILINAPQDVDDLRAAILRLATQGLLSEQRADELAESLVAQLRGMRQKMGSEKRLKKYIAAPIEDRDKPYAIPNTWAWLRLGEVADISSGATPLKGREDYYAHGSVPWITSTQTGQRLVTKAANFITDLAVKECRLKRYPVGTLLMAMYGQGKTRGQVTELRLEATTNQACAAIVLLETSETFKKFIRIVLDERYNEIRALAEGGAQPNLNGLKVKATVIPIPPKQEQARIIAVVEALMNILDIFQQDLAKMQGLALNFASSSVAAFTGIRIEEKEKMKTPKTELVSTLRIGNGPTTRDRAPLAAILVRNNGELSAKALWGSSGLKIDEFYQQLKTEMASGWITQPEAAYVKELETV